MGRLMGSSYRHVSIDKVLDPTLPPIHPLTLAFLCPPLCVPLGVEANFGHVSAFNVTTDAKLMRFLRRYRVTFTVIDFLDDDDEVRT
jgi:hypothetical protein